MVQLAPTQLEEKDIRALVRHPDPEVRARAAQRICRTVRDNQLSDMERLFARRLLAHMAEDAVAIVRRALAVTLRNSPELPRDVAMKLAADIDNIAVPVLANSPVFTDTDLVEILRSKASAKILAIAKRPSVSGDLVRAIIRFGDSHAVAEVAANDGARIDQKTAEHMLALYHDNDLLKNAFISRRDLPLPIMEKLITLVSEEAALLIRDRHKLPLELSVDIASRARERATIAITQRGMSDQDGRLLMKRIHSEGRLTASLLIRVAGLGRMSLLKYGLANRSGLAANKVALLLHDSGPLGLKTVCREAGLNDRETRIIRAACAIFRDLELASVEYDADYFQSVMIERMLTLPVSMSEADTDWLLERLDGIAQKAA